MMRSTPSAVRRSTSACTAGTTSLMTTSRGDEIERSPEPCSRGWIAPTSDRDRPGGAEMCEIPSAAARNAAGRARALARIRPPEAEAMIPERKTRKIRIRDLEIGGDAQSWLNLQSAYDLRRAEIAHAAEIREDIKPYGN